MKATTAISRKRKVSKEVRDLLWLESLANNGQKDLVQMILLASKGG
jgi:hypothetical protein